MKRTAKAFRSIDEMHALGSDYLLIWCFIYATDDQLTSPLLIKLESYDFGEIPTLLVMLRLDQNSWIGRDISIPSQFPELECFCCGGGICRIHHVDECEESISIAVNMANQLHSGWFAQSSRVAISDN